MVATKIEVADAVLDFARRLETAIRIDAIVLYGSYANGNPREESDIDVAVISPDFESLGLGRRQEIISDATLDRDRRLAPIGYPSSEYHNPSPQSFLEEIVRTGRLVYPKS